MNRLSNIPTQSQAGVTLNVFDEMCPGLMGFVQAVLPGPTASRPTWYLIYDTPRIVIQVKVVTFATVAKSIVPPHHKFASFTSRTQTTAQIVKEDMVRS